MYTAQNNLNQFLLKSNNKAVARVPVPTTKILKFAVPVVFKI